MTIGRPLPTYSIVILDAGRGPSRSSSARPARSASPGSASPRAISTAPDLTRGEVHRRLPRPAEQSVGPHLPHRRSRPHHRRRRDRISRPHRHADQAARLPHRTDRDRVGAARDPGDRPGRRRRRSSPSPARRSSSPITRSSTARAAPDRAAIVALMRARLPGYMTPAYLEQLPFIPTLVSNKADREAAAGAEVRASALRRRPCPAGDGRPSARSARRWRTSLGLDEVVDRRRFLQRLRRPLAV